MGRVEVEPPVAIEVPAPGEPTSDERRHHGLTQLPYQPWCNVCIRARGRENRHESRPQNQPSAPVIQCDYCFLKTEEDSPMVTVLLAIDTVYKQMVAIHLEKKGNRDPFACKSQSGRIRTIRRTSQSDHPRRLGARTHGSHPRRMRNADSRNTTNLTSRLRQVAPFCAGDFFSCAFMMSTNVGVDTATAAARRRQRRLCSWLRHERMTVAMTLAEMLHHTSRGQKFARVGEEVVHDAHDALRGQKTPPPGGAARQSL